MYHLKERTMLHKGNTYTSRLEIFFLGFLLVLTPYFTNSKHTRERFSFAQGPTADIDEGRRQYEMLQTESNAPRYGRCWKKALDFVNSGCKRLTDESQSRMAIAFTNCFLQKSGLQTYKCHTSSTVQECTEKMTDRAFNVYTDFFTHTQQICFFLESQVWQEEAHATISVLSESSRNVAQQLVETEQLQKHVLRSQEESLHNQQKLLHSGENLKETLHASSNSLRDTLSEFRSSSAQQVCECNECLIQINHSAGVLI